MATNLEIITRSLQELGVVAEGESASAAQGDQALDYLNMMMSELDVTDSGFNWPPQDTLSDTCPIPIWAENSIVAILTITLSAPFRAPLNQSHVTRAVQAENLIQKTMINLKLKGADMSNLSLGSQYLYDIVNG